MRVLAHRGLWNEPAQRNTRAALQAAVARGYGLETDIRDHGGKLVIAHDPPQGEGLLSFEDLLCDVGAVRAGPLAINIKADGLQGLVADALARAEGVDAFVFDMSVPDALGWLKTGLATFTRQSEYEPDPAFYDAAAGVWIDCFHADWIDGAVIEGHLKRGKRVALVSPELHGRDPGAAWNAWRACEHDTVMLCTDRPEAAQRFFGGAA